MQNYIVLPAFSFLNNEMNITEILEQILINFQLINYFIVT